MTAHREWTERHIRELIQGELKRLKGGAIGGVVYTNGAPRLQNVNQVSGSHLFPWALSNFKIIGQDEDENGTYDIYESVQYGSDVYGSFFVNGERIFATSTAIAAYDGNWGNTTIPVSFVNEYNAVGRLRRVYSVQDEKEFALKTLSATTGGNDVTGATDANGRSVTFRASSLYHTFFIINDEGGLTPWDDYDFYRTYNEDLPSDYVRVIRLEFYREEV